MNTRTLSSQGILILGHPRSGTTLLRRLLDAHSNIASPPETHLFGACGQFLSHDTTSLGVDMGVLAGLQFAGFDSERVLQRLREFAFGFMDEYAHQQGKERWAEKTAFDIFKLSDIEKLCTDKVFYLGIIRHPLDVALSCIEFCHTAGVYPDDLHRYIQQYPQPLTAFCHSWVDTTQKLLALGERSPNNCLIVRYEDLVAEPEESLKDVFDALGERWEPDILAHALSSLGVLGFSDHKSYQTDKIHEHSIGYGKTVSQFQQASVATLLNPLLDMCGYDRLNNEMSVSLDDARDMYRNSLLVQAKKSQGKP